jgi:osmotically-inducible protein OsmY
MNMKTDLQIQQDVLAELQWDPSVQAAAVGVEVKDGIVTLAGHVGSHAEKIAAQRAAHRVAGVKALTVELDVRLDELGRRLDADIAASVANVLAWTAFLPKDRVTLMVENGAVTLCGDLDWEYQRAAAIAAVQYMQGVRAIHNRITIKPQVAVDAIQGDIEAALQRRAHSDAQAISVSVKGSAVTLTGKISRWADRDLATHAAWGAPGVYNVVDNMEMAY